MGHLVPRQLPDACLAAWLTPDPRGWRPSEHSRQVKVPCDLNGDSRSLPHRPTWQAVHCHLHLPASYICSYPGIARTPLHVFHTCANLVKCLVTFASATLLGARMKNHN